MKPTRTILRRLLWFSLALVTLLCASMYYHFFKAEHILYEGVDAKTGIRLSAVCTYGDYSYRTYVVVSSPHGREISRNEIPYSADELSDCMEQPFYKLSSVGFDPSYKKLHVRFASEVRRAIKVPLFLEDLDLPVRPWEQPETSTTAYKSAE